MSPDHALDPARATCGTAESPCLVGARLLLEWHLRVGVEEASRRASRSEFPAIASYLERVQHFASLDLSRANAQREIAREQVGGRFEWAYWQEFGEAVSQPLHELLRAWPDAHNRPVCLADVAKLILYLLEHPEADQGGGPEARRTISASDRTELDRQADTFYRAYMQEEEHGIGGRHVLLACSLERSQDPHAMTLLSPAVLGFRQVRPGERPDDFLDALRSGMVALGPVTGETK